MSSSRWFAQCLFVVCVSVAVAQELPDTESEPNAPEDDGVLELVREMREARARSGAEYQFISVYSTHYMIGQQRFDSLSELLQYIREFPPDQFNMVTLGECSARAKMEELLERKAEVDQQRRPSESGFRRVGVGAPVACPWF